MKTINTSEGSKTPDEALAIFKRAKIPAGSLLGIFNQLEGFPQFKEACEHALAKPTLYNNKLQRLAKEKSTGRPQGAKVINNEIDLNKFLYSCGLRARIAITVKKEQARRLRLLMFIDNLQIDDHHKLGLTAVCMSGEWQQVSSTFSATLSLTSDEMLLSTQRALFGIVEKVELLSTLTERVKAYRAPTPLSDEVKATIAANPELFYDRSLFLEACEEQGLTNLQERVDEISDNATMEEVMMMFPGNVTRKDFLEVYITRFMAAVA